MLDGRAGPRVANTDGPLLGVRTTTLGVSLILGTRELADSTASSSVSSPPSPRRRTSPTTRSKTPSLGGAGPAQRGVRSWSVERIRAGGEGLPGFLRIGMADDRGTVMSGPHEARPHEQGGAGDHIARLCDRGATGAVDTNRAARQQRPPRGLPELLEAGVTRRSSARRKAGTDTRTFDHLAWRF
jgi:hypothetical protein